VPGVGHALALAARQFTDRDYLAWLTVGVAVFLVVMAV
jgi:hypothetical protein